MVFAAQWLSIPVSPSPGGVAGFTLGIFVLLRGAGRAVVLLVFVQFQVLLPTVTSTTSSMESLTCALGAQL